MDNPLDESLLLLKNYMEQNYKLYIKIKNRLSIMKFWQSFDINHLFLFSTFTLL